MRTHRSTLFKTDGNYQPSTEPDARIAAWCAPALFEDAESIELGRTVFEQAIHWQRFDIFLSSLVASHLTHYREAMGADLANRCEEHLNRFAIVDQGRSPCAACYDYMFHGYNDNMPAMATRMLALTGQLLDRRDCLDASRFNLESLCAHFKRRGLCSEFTSATYSPLTIVSLNDIVHTATDADIRELANACLQRVLLDVLGHWHAPTGTSGGTTARAYTVDQTQTLSVLNAFMWWLTNDAMTISPIDALQSDAFVGPIHHARNFAFNLAQFAEVMPLRLEIDPQLLQARNWPHSFKASSDWAANSAGGGSQSVQTYSYQQPLWWLATSSQTHTGEQTGQAVVLNAALIPTNKTTDWRQRVSLWTRCIADNPDHGEAALNFGASHHGSMIASENTKAFDTVAECDQVMDRGRYHCVQKNGSALLVGKLSSSLDGTAPERLYFDTYFYSANNQPDAIYCGEAARTDWDGTLPEQEWLCLRFGDVYVGLQQWGLSSDGLMCNQLIQRGSYNILQTNLNTQPGTIINKELRKQVHIGLLIEISDITECDSFEQFRQQVAEADWEQHNNFYRRTRARLRHGELEIVDSPIEQSARFRSANGHILQKHRITVSELDADQLAHAEHIRNAQITRTLPDANSCQSPFYNQPVQQIRSRTMDRF